MHKEGNERMVLDNLEAFSRKMLEIILDESKEGIERFVSILIAAQKEYKKPIQSLLSGEIYKRYRLRSPEMDIALKAILARPDAETRLTRFKALALKGEWNEGSLNFLLFKHLISAIPGYSQMNSVEQSVVILRIRKLVLTLVDKSIMDIQLTQKMSDLDAQMTRKFQEERVLELEKLAASKNPNREALEFVSSIEQFENFKGKTVFALQKEDEIWNLDWADFSGALHRLQPTDELISFLTINKIESTEKLSFFAVKKVLAEAVKSRDLMLDKIKAFINPKELGNQKVAGFGRDLSASFVLLGDNNSYSLIWINRWGKQEPLDLSNYPDLQSWLQSQKSVSEGQMKEFKTLLLQVNPHKSLAMDDFKKELSNCLAPVKVFVPKEAPKVGHLNLGLFKHVEDCLRQTHVQEKVVDEEVEISRPQRTPGKLNINHFAVAQLFGHSEDAPEDSSPRYLNN